MRAVPEWAAVLALAALPLRLLEVHLINRLLQLGAHAGDHLRHLLSISWLVTLALPLALLGRALFARACALGVQSGARVTPRLALRLPAAGLAGYAWAAMVWEGLFQLLGWLVLPLPALALGSGLAAATAPLTGEERPRPGPLASLALALRRAPPLRTCLGLCATLGAALGVAYLNLFFLVRVGLWLAGGLAGLDLSSWSLALGAGNRHFLLLLAAGAVSLVEPFWLASLVLAVRAARARESGEDLHARFAELRAEEAA
jgi:hypothetical protein